MRLLFCFLSLENKGCVDYYSTLSIPPLSLWNHILYGAFTCGVRTVLLIWSARFDRTDQIRFWHESKQSKINTAPSIIPSTHRLRVNLDRLHNSAPQNFAEDTGLYFYVFCFHTLVVLQIGLSSNIFLIICGSLKILAVNNIFNLNVSHHGSYRGSKCVYCLNCKINYDNYS